MNIIPAGEGLPLAPSICFICEQSPQTGCIDTFRTYMTPLPTRLTGRKYICIACVEEFAKALGWVSPETVLPLYSVINETNSDLAEARLRVEQLEAVHVQTLKDLLAKAVEPAPTKAPKVEKAA